MASSLFKKGPQKAKHDKTVSTQKPEPVLMTSESLPPRPSSIGHLATITITIVHRAVLLATISLVAQVSRVQLLSF